MLKNPTILTHMTISKSVKLAATRASARRLGLVTLKQMIAALAAAVECKPAGLRIVEVPEIRQAR